MNAKETILEISKLGISDSQIARLTGSSQPTISRIKSGATRDCMSTLAKKLEMILEAEVCNRSKAL